MYQRSAYRRDEPFGDEGGYAKSAAVGRPSICCSCVDRDVDWDSLPRLGMPDGNLDFSSLVVPTSVRSRLDGSSLGISGNGFKGVDG